jgi:glycosyltransferase involved in cell wall biosynthesis
MLSILIPTYNYDVTLLVERLIKQLEITTIPFEIRIQDDCSTIKEAVEANRALETIPNCFFNQNSKNLGRTATRQVLAESSKYPWLLFMDADVLPKNDAFIEKFELETQAADVVFGGIAYESKKPDKEKMLRWKYGSAREARPVAEREKMPYLSIISGCVLIEKKTFLSANTLIDNLYGGDVVFCMELQKMGATVKHIDNAVLHLGLESNASFIEKTNKGLESLLYFEQKGIIPNDYRPIQKAYRSLENNKGIKLFQWVMKLFYKSIQKNLLSASPSMFLFDLYRLYFYTTLKENQCL